jgi:arylsulfatase A-like enzyme
VVLLLDTLRADRVGCYGWSAAETPNIDALAARGVRFADAMSAGPWTLPSHASLFSSLYVSEHGMWNPTQRLSEDVETLAEVLRRRGYATAAFTEGGYVRAEFGFAQGFDSFRAKQVDVRETFQSAGEWMRSASEPFFAFVQTYRIHTPFDPPDEIRARHVRPYGGTLPHDVHVPEHVVTPEGQRPMNEEDVRYLSDLYDSEIAYTDAAVGALLAFLESSGLSERTCVVLTSDHGEELGEHGHFDHGWSLYQDQLHVPLLAYAPGRFEGGKVVLHTVHGIDLAPTLAALAGARPPEVWSGVELSLDPPAADRPLATPFFLRRGGHPAIALRAGKMKYIDYPPGQRPLDPADGGPKLYDLSTDPLESHNLWPPDDPGRWTTAIEAFYRAHSLPAGAEARGTNANDFSDTEGLVQDLDQLGYGGGDR